MLGRGGEGPQKGCWGNEAEEGGGELNESCCQN